MKTLTKSTLLSLLLCSFTALPSSLSTEAVGQAYEDRNGPAKYLELYFVIRPNNAIKACANQIYTYGICAIATSFLTYINMSDQVVEAKLSLKTTAPILATGSLLKCVYDWYLSRVETSIKKDCLISFLTNWNIHCSHVPTVLVPLFEELSKKYSSNKEISSTVVDQVYEIIIHFIEHEFPARYKNETKVESSLQITKAITDVYKNIA